MSRWRLKYGSETKITYHIDTDRTWMCLDCFFFLGYNNMHMAFKIQTKSPKEKQFFIQISIMQWQNKWATGFCVLKDFRILSHSQSNPMEMNGWKWAKINIDAQHMTQKCAFHFSKKWTWVNLLGFFLLFYFWYREHMSMCVHGWNVVAK